MVTGLHWAANIPTRWLEDELKSRLLRQAVLPTPSSGEKTPSCPMTLTEWQDWVDQMQTDVLVLKQKVAALEAGPQSPPTTAKDTRADRWGVVTESTNQTTPPSSPSGRSTTPTCLVEPGCACALLSHKPPTTLWQSMQIQGKWERVLRVGCPHCDALWAFVQIVAQAVPASPSEST